MPYITFKDYPKKKFKCPIRLLRICKDNRIKRLAQFSEMTFKELLLLPECGTRTAILVRQILKENGLDFSEQPKINVDKFYRQRNRQIIELFSNDEGYKKAAL